MTLYYWCSQQYSARRPPTYEACEVGWIEQNRSLAYDGLQTKFDGHTIPTPDVLQPREALSI